mmetsp:Transcript_31822/g.83073  ORF Transcript_31822/g.83073 Transcript_31822/m.83073 type:complete len:201 (-) Transcript_31822:1562-2164(-)
MQPVCTYLQPPPFLIAFRSTLQHRCMLHFEQGGEQAQVSPHFHLHLQCIEGTPHLYQCLSAGQSMGGIQAVHTQPQVQPGGGQGRLPSRLLPVLSSHLSPFRFHHLPHLLQPHLYFQPLFRSPHLHLYSDRACCYLCFPLSPCLAAQDLSCETHHSNRGHLCCLLCTSHSTLATLCLSPSSSMLRMYLHPSLRLRQMIRQ